MNRGRIIIGHLGMAAIFAASVTASSCGGGIKGLPGGDKLNTDIPDKYEAYFEKCEKYEADIEETKKYIEETPMLLAEKLDLKEDATLDEVTDAITSRIQDQVIKAGAHVEVTIEGGIEASASAMAGTGGASAEAGVSAEVRVEIKVVGDVEVSEGLAELIATGEMAIKRLVESARKIKAIAETTPELIEEGKALAQDVPDDIKNPATAAQVTAKLTGFTDMFGEVKALLETSVEVQVELKVSFEASASAEASAG